MLTLPSRAGLNPKRRKLDSEAGVTLVELVLTIAILGIAITMILWGMLTGIKVSALHRNEATADTLLRSAAETVVDVRQMYHDCAGTGSYSLGSLPGSVSILKVEYWRNDNPATFDSTCPSSDHGMQLVTIVATSDGQTVSLSVVKRKP